MNVKAISAKINDAGFGSSRTQVQFAEIRVQAGGNAEEAVFRFEASEWTALDDKMKGIPLPDGEPIQVSLTLLSLGSKALDMLIRNILRGSLGQAAPLTEVLLPKLDLSQDATQTFDQQVINPDDGGFSSQQILVEFPSATRRMTPDGILKPGDSLALVTLNLA
ncbi:MAG: hypothetical protein RRB13_06765 [bacterium]|nr:hypothetical protein [bacterium]